MSWKIMAPVLLTKYSVMKRMTWDLGLTGRWSELANGVKQFRNSDGACLSWSSTRGTIWYGGPQPAKDRLAATISGEVDRRQNPVAVRRMRRGALRRTG
jgi:hypothetical protein